MKSFAVSLESIAAPEALLAAWRRYRSAKRRRPAVAWFELTAESRVLRLSSDILGGRYRHGPYRLLVIRDPKPRMIAVASVADRVVHRAVHDALGPLFDRRFTGDTYACLEGRGSHRAVLRFFEHQRRFAHVMHLDIERYFPSVDHAILLDLMSPRLRDARVLELLRHILATGAELYGRPEVVAFFGDGDTLEAARPRGLPIGNLTSQWWGNIYLDGLDHFIKRELKAKAYLRYMDDLVLFADEPATLRTWRAEISAWLTEKRRLRLNPRHGHVRATTLPQSYLGYRISRAGIDLGRKAQRRFRKHLPALARGSLEHLERALVSWRGAATF